jgi:hypothetical protein
MFLALLLGVFIKAVTPKNNPANKSIGGQVSLSR